MADQKNTPRDPITQTTSKDTAVKGPASPVPNDRPTWEPSAQPGQTNQDPLGVGNDPGPFTADPTDNRAQGKQSASGLVVEGEKTSPSTAGQVPGLTPLEALPKDVLGVQGSIKARKVEMLKDEDVRLTAAHYLNDEMFDAGAVLEGYTGPKSANMVVLNDEESNAIQAKKKADADRPTFKSVRR